MTPGRNLGLTGPRASWLGGLWKTTHTPDYIGFVVLLVGWILVVRLVTPFHRLFFVNDLQISYPHAVVERVSVAMNFVYALFIPLGVLIAYNSFTRAPFSKHEVTYLAFFISIVLSSLLTDIVKNAVGRPRPDLLDRCQPDSKTKPNVLVSIEVCTAPISYALNDGWRSFPSGHSSFSFAGLGFLSLFFAGQLHVFRHAGGGRDLSRALFCLLPLVGAAMVAISRCEDYRHDVYDVCVGSALGMTIAYWSYRRHFRALSSTLCHEPYPPPGQAPPPGAIDAAESGWSRVPRDEEEEGGNVGYELNRVHS